MWTLKLIHNIFLFCHIKVYWPTLYFGRIFQPGMILLTSGVSYLENVGLLSEPQMCFLVKHQIII